MNSPEGIHLEIAIDHPAFDGHFPGFPVVPGVTLLDEAMFAIAAETGVLHNRISWAKFLRPVRPGQPVMVRHYVEPGGTVRFEITTGTDKVGTGRLSHANTP